MDLTGTPALRAGATPSDAPPSGGPDRGFTFVETVLTVVLMGIVIVPVLAAVRGAVRVSSVSQSAAQVETVLVNAADRVQRAADDSCDFQEVAQNAAESMQWSPDRVAVQQEYLDVATSPPQWVTGPLAPVGRGPACPSSMIDTTAIPKRISITVTSPDGAVRRAIQVVKSDV